MTLVRWLFVLVVAPLALGQCKKKDSLTASEARVSVEEIASTSQAETLTGTTIEIGTNFTLGAALEEAAQELHDFVISQIPCAQVTLAGASVRIEYGVRAVGCTYRGQTFSGTHTVSVTRNSNNQVVVDHTWDALSNGRLEVSGEATATWDFDARTRHIVHELTWTNLQTDNTGVGSGDRVQSALDGDITMGIQVDGTRSWEGQRGTWDLSIDGVEMRWQDPVPQSGSYTLATPFDKTATLSFDRLDADTITVTVSSGSRSFDFNVNSLGTIASD